MRQMYIIPQEKEYEVAGLQQPIDINDDDEVGQTVDQSEAHEDMLIRTCSMTLLQATRLYGAETAHQILSTTFGRTISTGPPQPRRFNASMPLLADG